MTTSSQPENSLEDLLKQLRDKTKEKISNSTTTVSDNTLDTITITNTGSGYSPYMYSSTGSACLTGITTYSVGSGINYNNGTTISTISNICPTASYNTINVSGGTSTMFNWGEEWDDRFPDWGRVKEMCEQYPGLKIAFEKFKTVYKLVRDDYDTPENKRPRP
jgi:hypothetical protein